MEAALPSKKTQESRDSAASSTDTAARPVSHADRAGTGQPDNKWSRAAKSPGVTPMMAQFFEIKAAYSDCLLFYRMGDFYELFFEDAEQAAAALDITLTKRGKHDGKDVAMAGVPVHAAESYLARLIRKAFRVAVCEQVEDPAEAKKRGAKSVVRREVVRLVTPGTLTEDTLLNARAHNYLAALGRAEGHLALAVVDISTGEFLIAPTLPGRLSAELARFTPSELLLPDNLGDDAAVQDALADWRDILSPLGATRFDSGHGRWRLEELFNVATLDGFASFGRAELSAAGALVDYLEDTQKGKLPRLAPPKRLPADGAMMIDAATRRSLELTRTQGGDIAGSLLATIDRSVTGAGARLMAKRLSAPLTDPVRINERLDMVQYMLERTGLRQDMRTLLKATPDMERALARLSLGRGGPRDLMAIRLGLDAAHSAREVLAASGDGLGALPDDLAAVHDRLGRHHDLAGTLKRALVEEPPLSVRDGGFIAADYDAPLDEFRTLRDQSRRLILELEADYQRLTAIASLKIKHNNVLGYHVDVTARHADKLMAPPLNGTFIHRQTLANAVRFSTADLSKLAGKISEAGDRALALEQDIFTALTGQVMDTAATISEAALALAELDVGAGNATLAAECGYVRPDVDDSLAFTIRNGRHPVVEAALAGTSDSFVANDCQLEENGRLWLLTGPNMAGKSTFLRQNALMAVMAQMGGYVPAVHAHIGVVDRLFSRVGASDDLAHGRSTFMVEMVETAAILNQAGPRSLVILDEIGRGTATYDGLSIAWAAVEHLHNINQSRALFATHYHELTALKETLDALALRSMKVREWKGEVIFLHEVAKGAADRSYGIQVAKLAGLPPRVIARARQVLDHLESQDTGGGAHGPVHDLPLFQDIPARSSVKEDKNPLEQALEDINPDDLSPRDALTVLYKLQDILRGRDSSG